MSHLRSFNRFVLISLALLGFSVSSVHASTIIDGDLLDQAGANQLESWLGVGSQTFTNIYDETRGASVAGWNAAVEGRPDTISIYDITYQGQDILLGGYRHSTWDNMGQYEQDSAAFVFNLTSPLALTHTPSGSPQYAVYDHSQLFATFGGGHDLIGGINNLGSGGQSYSNIHSYRTNLDTNLLVLTGLLGQPAGPTNFTVNGLETYVYAPSAVPVPAAAWLFGTALVGFIGMSRRRNVA